MKEEGSPLREHSVIYPCWCFLQKVLHDMNKEVWAYAEKIGQQDINLVALCFLSIVILYSLVSPVVLSYMHLGFSVHPYCVESVYWACCWRISHCHSPLLLGDAGHIKCETSHFRFTCSPSSLADLSSFRCRLRHCERAVAVTVTSFP